MAAAVDGALCDLEDIVDCYAKTIFQQTATKQQKSLKAESLQFSVDWSRVVIDHDEPVYENVDLVKIPNSSTLFKTSFSNTTDREQTYSFRTDRSTRSTCNISVDSTFTKGGEVSVGFKLPGEVLSANAGYKAEVSLTKQKGQSFEEELTWGVDSQIQVAPKTRATAEIRVTEEKFSGSFSVESRYQGRVRVSITNLEDNNALVKYIDGDLAKIVEKYAPRKQDIRIADGLVTFISRGQCNFRFGIEQNVHIKQEKLSDEELNTSQT